MSKKPKSTFDASIRFARRALAMLSALALSCALLPAVAFASPGQLTTGSLSQSAITQTAMLSTQASAVKSAKKTTKKLAAFTIKKYRKYKKFTYATGEWRYGKPVIKGSSKIVKKMNKSLNARYKEHARQTGIVDMAKEADSPNYKGVKFHFTADTKATYNKNGYVSFKYQWDWFAGGVHNDGYYGDVYSLKTGKKLNVSQVVAGNASQVRRSIASAAASQLNLDINTSYTSAGSAYKQITSKKITEFEFYLQSGNVIVVIEPYTWPGQRGALTVTLKGNYA